MNLEHLKAIYGKETLYSIEGDSQIESAGIPQTNEGVIEKAPVESVTETITKEVEIETKEPTPAQITLEGANKQKTIVIVNDKSQGVIKESNKAFLEKILSAAKLNLDDIAICNNSVQPITIGDVSKQSPTERVILFGPGAFEVGVKDAQIPKYELKINNGVSILCCDNLELIQTDQNKKKALWLGLQRMFQL